MTSGEEGANTRCAAGIGEVDKSLEVGCVGGRSEFLSGDDVFTGDGVEVGGIINGVVIPGEDIFSRASHTTK